MSIIACSVAECEKPVVARGICRSHYKKAKRSGTLEDFAKRPIEWPTSCAVEECEKEVIARGWCSAHYRLWMRTGSTVTTKFTKHPCAIDGCNGLASKRGWCDTHYKRWRLTGTAGDASIKQRKAPIVDGARPCGDCREWLPLASYNMNGHKTGPKSMCRDCERVRNVAWREANPTYWQEWQKANPQKVRDIANRRRAQKVNGEYEEIDRDLVFERDGYECKLCMRPLDMDAKFPHPWSPTLDHIQPLSKGGHHLYVNLQAAHFRCNTAKGDRVDPETFAYLLQEL